MSLHCAIFSAPVISSFSLLGSDIIYAPCFQSHFIHVIPFGKKAKHILFACVSDKILEGKTL
jgi:hypothetical protein